MQFFLLLPPPTFSFYCARKASQCRRDFPPSSSLLCCCKFFATFLSLLSITPPRKTTPARRKLFCSSTENTRKIAFENSSSFVLFPQIEWRNQKFHPTRLGISFHTSPTYILSYHPLDLKFKAKNNTFSFRTFFVLGFVSRGKGRWETKLIPSVCFSSSRRAEADKSAMKVMWKIRKNVFGFFS